MRKLVRAALRLLLNIDWVIMALFASVALFYALLLCAVFGG